MGLLSQEWAGSTTSYKPAASTFCVVRQTCDTPLVAQSARSERHLRHSRELVLADLAIDDRSTACVQSPDYRA